MENVDWFAVIAQLTVAKRGLPLLHRAKGAIDMVIYECRTADPNPDVAAYLGQKAMRLLGNDAPPYVVEALQQAIDLLGGGPPDLVPPPPGWSFDV